jgi:hypothetical protein
MKSQVEHVTGNVFLIIFCNLCSKHLSLQKQLRYSQKVKETHVKYPSFCQINPN